MVATATAQPEIIKGIPKTKARDIAPAELYRKIQNRMKSYEMLTKRADYRQLVLADLREGIPAYVIKGFKWEGEMIQPFTLWHPGMEFLGRVAQVMEAAEYGRILITQAAAQAGTKLKELKLVAEQLAPLLGKANAYQSEASQARNAQEQARLAEIMYKAAAEQAETNFKSADKELKNYVSKLTLEI